MTALADTLYAELHAQFEARADAVRAESVRCYFKEPIQTHGMPMTVRHELAQPVARRVKRDGTIDDALALCEHLLASGFLEQGSAIEDIMRPFRPQLAPEHMATFDRWVDYCTNWGVTDSLCLYVISELLYRHPQLSPSLIPWASSPNRWRRRAACVALVKPVARGLIPPTAVFAVTDPLMLDRDDMVQKGAGWALRELLVRHPAEVVEYLERWSGVGRILVRYLMEKATPEVRARFIKQR